MNVRLLFVSSTLFLITASLVFIDGNCAKAAEKPLIKTTHVYKTVGDVKVEADVYRPEGAEAWPVVVGILETGFGDVVKVP